MIEVAHVFYDTHLSKGLQGLGEILGRKLKPGEVAIFINKAFTGVKILTPGNCFFYHRSETGLLAAETIRRLPSVFGGGRLVIAQAIEKEMAKRIEKNHGKTAKTFKKAA